MYVYIYDYMYIFDHLSDDADRIRETQSEKVVLLISSTFRYTMLCNHIKHYTAGIDYNQDFYIYIYIVITSYYISLGLFQA